MKKAFILSLSLLLCSCSSPTRNDVDQFFVVNSGQVHSEQVPHFVDCLSDGFNKSHWGVSNYEVRQTQRAKGYRVETYTGSFNYLLMSADVFFDGKVVLYESSSAQLINTQGESKTFSECLAQFQVNGTKVSKK